MQAKRVKVRDVDVHYLEAGEGNRPTVVLLHGLGSGSGAWRYNIPHLARRFRVIAPDMPGFGDSQPGEAIGEYTAAAMTGFLAEFMSALGLERAHVVGWSLGGGVAASMALDHPDVVERLVLVAPAAIGDQVHVIFRLLALPFVGEYLLRPSRAATERLTKTLMVYDPERAPEDIIDYHHSLSLNPWTRETTLRIVRRNGVLWWGQRRQKLGSRLAEIASPTLVIWGRYDRILPVGHAEILRRLVPEVKVEIFEDCGHSPPFEYPDEFNALVEKFLSS